MDQLRIGIASPWANLGSVSIRSWPRQPGSMLQAPARTARQTAVARVMYVRTYDATNTRGWLIILRRILAATPASGRDTADPAVYRSGVRRGGGGGTPSVRGDPVPGLGGRGSGPVRGRLGSREPLSLSLCLSHSLSLPLSRSLSLSLTLPIANGPTCFKTGSTSHKWFRWVHLWSKSCRNPSETLQKLR